MRALLALSYLLAPAALVVWLFWSYHWCHLPDPAMDACRGTVSATVIKRCVSTALPAPSELQPPIPPITRAFKSCKKRIGREGVEAVLPYLNSTLAVIERVHGRASPAYAYALGQVITLLAGTTDRFDLIRPYSKAAIAVSRQVYGTNHRETAVALNTHADVLTRPQKDDYAEAAIPLMREAVDIRRRVLGPDHKATVFAETRLARLLFQKWQRSDDRPSQAALLKEAENLAEDAASALGRTNDRPNFYGAQAEALAGRIAYAQGDYKKALAHFSAAFEPTNFYYCWRTDEACTDYIALLRKLGRDKEAGVFAGGLKAYSERPKEKP